MIDNKEVTQRELRAYSKTYPSPLKTRFFHYAIENWKNLVHDKTFGGNYWAALLHKQLSGTKHEPLKTTSFFLWLTICIQRPWENKWQLEANSRLIEDISNIIIKFSKIPLIPPDVSTLRRHITKEDFIVVIKLLPALTQEFRNKWSILFKKLQKQLLLPINEFKTFENIDIEFLKFAFYIKEKKFVHKSELLRRFHIKKEHRDLLLNKLKNEPLTKDLFKVTSYSWVIYKGL